MRRFPDPRATLHQLRLRGLGWGVRRVREELRTPTYGASRRAALQVERARSVARRAPEGASDPTGGADVVAVYELTPGSIGFDFAYFLVFAEAFARTQGLRSIFVLFLSPDHERDTDPAVREEYDEGNASWRFANIVLPIVGMHASTVGYAVLPQGSDIRPYVDGTTTYPPRFSATYRPTFSYAQSLPSLRASDFDGFRAPSQASRYVESWIRAAGIDRPIVAITLRQRTYDPARNSDVPEWVAFASWLVEQGYAPVFVPDTDSAWDLAPEVAAFPVFAEAPWNLGLRMALYESAHVCFFFSNGTSALPILSRSVRYVAMNPPNERSRHATSEALAKVAWDTSRRRLDFAVPGQLLSSESDNVENLKREFTAFEESLGR